jgi:DNA-binding beta-propeller fold protein YncE
MSYHPLFAAAVVEGDVTTFAGFSSGSTNGVGSNALFNLPRGVSVSSDGSYALVADRGNHLIRQIILSTATVSTLAGLALSAGSTNGVGSDARFNYPIEVSVSSDGSYALVADTDNHLIRQIVLSTASVSTLAGRASTSGSTNGVGSNALFNLPRGVSVSSDGSYALVADRGNHLIRQIILSTATVSTLAGLVLSAGSTNGVGSDARFFYPIEVSVSSDGSYALVADTDNHLIRQIVLSTASVSTLAGRASTSGSTNGVGSNARFLYPQGVSVSSDGSYAVVIDSNNHLIRKIVLSTASVSSLAGLALSAGSTNGVGSDARFYYPRGVSVSSDGSYALVADTDNNLIRQIILSSASVSTLAGLVLSPGSTNGVGSNALFNLPRGVSVSSDGSYALVADRDNHLIRKIILSTASVSSLTGLNSTSGSTNGVGSNARFNYPIGVCVSSDRSYALVADYNNNLIRKIVLSTAATPTSAPSSTPTNRAPSVVPSSCPSSVPTSVPSCAPSVVPSSCPSSVPTSVPSCAPSVVPSSCPSSVPTSVPSCAPSVVPSSCPSSVPTIGPSSVSTLPTVSDLSKYSFGVVFGDSERQGLAGGSALLLDYFYSRHDGLNSFP